MKYSVMLLTLLISLNLSGQVKFGTYNQNDSSLRAALRLYPDKKFNFYDARRSSCLFWMNYDGTWKIVKDTITFYWQYKWKQNADTLITKTNSSRQDISLSFQYDDGEPIPNVEASYTCGFEEDRKKYTSDQNGKIIIPWAEGVDFKKAACTERWLSYSMDNKYVYLGSNSLQDTLTNDFTVIIRKKTKSGVIKFAKKYLIAGDSLVEIAPPDNYSRWGNFKFFSVKYQL